MLEPRHLRSVEATAVLLFLLQGLIVLFSRLFGVIYDAVFAATLGLSNLVLIVGGVLLAFAAPLFLPRRVERLTLLVGAVAASASRLTLTLDHPSIQLWSAVGLTAAGGCYAVTLLKRRPIQFATALAIALAAAQLLRVAGNTYDISLRRSWLPVQAILSVSLGAAAWIAHARPATDPTPAPSRGISTLSGLTLGAFLFLETSLLGFPNALARWTGARYALVAPLLMAATVFPLLGSAQWGGFALFVATLTIGWVTDHEFYQLAILGPMLIAQLAFVASIWSTTRSREGGRTLEPFVLGMIVFLLLNVALAFAFTYPYTLPAFREKGDYVLLLAIAMLLVPTPGRRASRPELPTKTATFAAWGAAALAVGVTALFALPGPAPLTTAHAGPLRVATYNIHYGYDTHWRYSLEDQARAIEQSGADIVFLQEVDAGRITSYGVDDALWLGRRLGMEHVFGPALEDLSGVAILSRYPVTESDTEHLASRLEQSAIVHARVRLSPSDPEAVPADEEAIVDAYGTWLGLEPLERARQLEDVLAFIGEASPAVLGGDFNATPDSPTYAALREANFEDPYDAVDREGWATSPATDPVERIDYVLARGLEPVDVQVLDALASDHRLVVAEFNPP